MAAERQRRAIVTSLPTTAGVPPVPPGIGAPSSGGGRDISPFVSSAGPGSSVVASPPGTSGGAVLPKSCPSCFARYPADFKVCPRDASPLVDAPDDGHDPLLGATLADSYQIVRVVGEGGMGRVYEARHTRLTNRRFALKILHPEYARQPEVVARFQREAEAASGIEHPNVVDVYDVHHTADGRPYLVGEFLEGQEFGEYLREKGKIPVGEAVNIARQVCHALAAAHAHEVVHRDMKPENVFLVGDLSHPQVKVLDFGISKVGDAGGTALTRTGMIMGTPSYMAPEQARGEKVDHRADIYAVGGILYRALTGSKPFDSDDPSATLTAVLTEDPPRPRSLEPSIPESLELVIQKAMAKEPADRYPTMAALDAELAPFDPEPESHGLGRAMGLGGAGAAGGRGDADPGARTVLAAGAAAQASQASLSRAARDARLARPLIVMLTVLGYGWILGGLVDAVSGILLTVRGGSPNITKTEALLVTSAAFATTLTPLVLWVRQLGRGWGNSVRAVELADGMRRVAAFAIGASGIGALVIRLMEVVLRAQALDVAWPFWSPVLFGASLLGGWVAYLSLRIERR